MINKKIIRTVEIALASAVGTAAHAEQGSMLNLLLYTPVYIAVHTQVLTTVYQKVHASIVFEDNINSKACDTVEGLIYG